MQVAFCNTSIILCGGLITNYEIIKELRKRGYEANMYAESGNEMLEKTYSIKTLPINALSDFTESDVIIANRWEQCEELEKYKGKKYQYVQGADLKADCGDDWKENLIKARNNPNWELIGVSAYALQDWGRGTTIPNGISERFFVNHGLERDIDAICEGNNEPNKNISYALEQAKKDGHKNIAWLGREVDRRMGFDLYFENPPQKEIPKIYQRAKHFYKYSKSEGFCLPLWEATLSGCEIHTWDMGCNKDWVYTKEEAQKYTWKNAVDKLLTLLEISVKM